MTPLLTINLLRVLFVTFCAVIGANISSALIGNLWPGLVLGLVLGLVVVLIDRLLKGVSLRLFSSATFGLLLGLIFANLLMASQVLRYQSETMQWSVRLIVYAVFGYLGMMLAMRSSRDEFSLIIPYVRFARETTQHEPLVVDTNVIIDGRISDLCATGFLSRSCPTIGRCSRQHRQRCAVCRHEYLTRRKPSADVAQLSPIPRPVTCRS
jgi:uncharacterized protein YacL